MTVDFEMHVMKTSNSTDPSQDAYCSSHAPSRDSHRTLPSTKSMYTQISVVKSRCGWASHGATRDSNDHSLAKDRQKKWPECAIGSINSHEISIDRGWENQPNSRGLYTYYKDPQKRWENNHPQKISRLLTLPEYKME